MGYAEPLLATTDSSNNEETDVWVLFSLDGQTYALRIWEVERIVRAVEVRPLPESPAHILGVVNIQGRVLPVVDLRARFGKPSRDISLDDHFIVTWATGSSAVVLPVDAALGSQQIAGGTIPEDEIARTQCLSKVLTLGNEMVYALDLKKLVAADDLPAETYSSSMRARLE